jgi:hypothetical protein
VARGLKQNNISKIGRGHSQHEKPSTGMMEPRCRKTASL